MAWLQLSLRWKLTLWFLAIFSGVLAGVVYSGWLYHRNSAERELDERLLGLARAISELIRNSDIADEGDLTAFQPIAPSFKLLAIRDVDGLVLARLPHTDVSSLPPLPSPEASYSITALESGASVKLLGESIMSRMVTYRFPLQNGTIRHLDLANTLDLSEDLSLVNDVILTGAAGALLASALAAWVVAGRGVKHLKLLTEAAERVEPAPTGPRLNLKSDETEVERLKNALNDALSRLESGYRAQEQFISNVAHDLKTPIAVMLTESQVLRPETATTQDFIEYRQSMISEMQRLGSLVESFLTLARIDQRDAQARVADVSLLDVMMEAVAQCDGEARAAGIRLLATVSDENAEFDVRGDPDLLRTMLANLVRNSLKFSPQGSTVEVGVGIEGGTVELTVLDQGECIPEELRSAIFERAIPIATTSPRVIGSGLGLAIARSVVSLHNGTIEVLGHKGNGCMFRVRMPRNTSTGEESGTVRSLRRKQLLKEVSRGI